MKRTPRGSDAAHREEGMLQDSKPSELQRWPRLPKSLPLLCTDLLLEPLKAVCLGGRLYSSVLWTVPQNSAKMEKKKAMSRGEDLCQLIGFSCPLVGSMEEGVAGPAIKMIKRHQCMAKNKKLNSKPPKNPRHQHQVRRTLLCHWEICQTHTWAPLQTQSNRDSPWACRHCGGCLGCSKHWQQLQQPWLQLSHGEKCQVRGHRELLQ